VSRLDGYLELLLGDKKIERNKVKKVKKGLSPHPHIW